MVKVGEEDLRIRGRFHGHGGDHATYAHCTQYREDLPVALGRGFGDAPSSPSTSIPLGHLPVAGSSLPCRVLWRGATFFSAGSQARPLSSRDAACSHGCRSQPSVRPATRAGIGPACSRATAAPPPGPPVPSAPDGTASALSNRCAPARSKSSTPTKGSRQTDLPTRQGSPCPDREPPTTSDEDRCYMVALSFKLQRPEQFCKESSCIPLANQL